MRARLARGITLVDGTSGAKLREADRPPLVAGTIRGAVASTGHHSTLVCLRPRSPPRGAAPD
jgi:hypothetical protein